MFVYQRFGHTSDAQHALSVTPFPMSVTILCYHKVGPASEEGRRLNIEPSRLATHVRFFARKNRPFVLAKDLAESIQDGMVCFSFDDAYASTMHHAPLIFEEQGVRASFYAVPGRVGQDSDWDGEQSRPLADWDDLRAAQTRGHEIGNHSQNHRRLAELDPLEQLNEIQSAHRRLLDEGVSSRSFCYPYGSYDARTVEAVQKAGYPVGLALNKHLAETSDNPLTLPRIVIAYSDSLPMLLYKLILKPRLKPKRKT
jgi:peptidoglycan/xylan/chitin deacetylase (PgdA/CDA1 family)